MKILIIQKKFMGDILVTSTVIPLLKKKYPDAEITFLLDENYRQILIGNPFWDHLIFWNKENFSEMLFDIRNRKFDVVIDLYSKIDTGFLTFFSGAEKRIGFFKKYTQIFYNYPIKRKKESISKNITLAIEHRLQLLEPLGISFQEVFPKTFLLDEEIENAKKLLADHQLTESDDLIMISTFGSNEIKTYPIEYMANVLDQIVDIAPQSKLLCNYLPHQKEKFIKLFGLISQKTQNAVIKDFETKDLREFSAVTSLCKCLIGNEGGATNVSKSLGIPTFTIFAPHIEPKGWAWTSQPDLDRFLHLNDFVKDSKDYKDFKPEFLKLFLKEFLENVTKSHP
ncbi:glycosyltransferase family 9 protein [Epilithonimonas ginsengisoli]|uniref:Glycosyltransferase family 9 protein n=1 Tax=Epilithonimonas ginsengisoli TaxID=1245592 RepID=A0ABU4JCC6_9FLAO|nr:MULTISPECIES: glycosyltransferase family 9 protein [Chryseobacterium group]MBV6878430.1 glycosyltransferase family 9 protein [Epilithonimonas sp. FP105]MDW8547327.1 glycosyltransferase family 9 protein [Epilithonimonas ginsengisoli]OAH69074.1 hypothetical protein AXA65_16735 [Chryseobacterium sp. FP211-J200]